MKGSLERTPEIRFFVFVLFLESAMMFPSVIAPPAMYPNMLRPTAGLTLPQSLQSAFTTHSSFLVEDLLRISRPGSFLHRTIPSPSVSPPTTGSTTAVAMDHHGSISPCIAKRTSPPQTPVPNRDPSYLKFGVNAILAPSTRSGMFFIRIAHVYSKIITILM